MRKSLNIGCVGTSSIMELIQEAIQLTPGLICNLIYSRDKERGKRFADLVGVKESCDNYEEMLNRSDIDVIYIASPNKYHVPQAMQAMKHGKHVIVEKPIAVRENDIQKLMMEAREKRVFFFEAITTLFMPNFVACKKLLVRLGKIESVELCYGQYSSKYKAYLRGDEPSNFSTEMQGGALNDLGIYCIHLAVDLFGWPEAVDYDAEYGYNGIDLAGTLRLRYPQVECRIKVAKNKDLNSGCRISGENGYIIEQGPLNSFAACRAEVKGILHYIDKQKESNRMLYELSCFRDAILNHDIDFFCRMARQSMIAASVLEQAHGM